MAKIFRSLWTFEAIRQIAFLNQFRDKAFFTRGTRQRLFQPASEMFKPDPKIMPFCEEQRYTQSYRKNKSVTWYPLCLLSPFIFLSGRSRRFLSVRSNRSALSMCLHLLVLISANKLTNIFLCLLSLRDSFIYPPKPWWKATCTLTKTCDSGPALAPTFCTPESLIIPLFSSCASCKCMLCVLF